MATVINNPTNGGGEDSGLGFVLGVILVLAVIVLFFVYGLPYLRTANNAQNQPNNVNVNLKLPTSNGSTTTPTPTPALNGY